MCDCDFETAAPDTRPLDPRKRVRHFTGLVMGPDEFRQDQVYLMERDRLHQRSLHGYGTALGLGVEVRAGDGGRPEVRVAPGLAVTPQGDSVCVPLAQCARLDDWLAAHADELDDLLGGSPPVSPPGSPAGALTLWVVLCPRECDTDLVPVLGDPCRTPEDATAASRTADDFLLRLATTPPEQVEEEAVRRLGELLRAIEVSDAPGDFLTPEELADRVRQLAPGGSPPELGDPGWPGSPPLPARLHPDDLDEALDEAWRAWITEVRPRLAGGAAGCADGGPACVLLARLDFAVEQNGAGWRVAGELAIDERERPYLLHTRLLQERLMCCHGAAPAIGSPPFGSPPFGSPPGSPPVGSPPPGSPPGSPPGPVLPSPFVHGDLSGLDADDHLQYLLVDPATRALITDLDADGSRLVNLGEAGAPDPGDAVRWDRAVKVGDAAGGDLAGTYPDPQVAALQGSPLSPAAPDPGDVLVWDGAAWVPGPPAAVDPPPPPDLLDLDLVRVTALSWLHAAGSVSLAITHDGDSAFGLALAFGTSASEAAPVQATSLDPRTVRLWVRLQDADTPFVRRLEVPAEVIPARVVATGPGRRITATATDSGRLVGAVLLRLDPDLAGRLVEGRNRLEVELRGDFVRDESGRSIDAEHVRAELPSGARRSGARMGIQGGRFESWLRAGRLVIGDIDLNLMPRDRLTDLPGVGPALAGRIVTARRRLGGLQDLEDLRAVDGISDNLINRLRELQG